MLAKDKSNKVCNLLYVKVVYSKIQLVVYYQCSVLIG